MDAPGLAVSRDGSAAVVWMDRREGRPAVWLRRVGPGGDEADRLLSLEEGTHPQVALDAAGEPACVWEERVDGATRIACLFPGADEPVLLEGDGAGFPVVGIAGDLVVVAHELGREVVVRSWRLE